MPCLYVEPWLIFVSVVNLIIREVLLNDAMFTLFVTPVVFIFSSKNILIDYNDEQNILINYNDEQNILIDYNDEQNILIDYNDEQWS